jgi:hypothetical protein
VALDLVGRVVDLGDGQIDHVLVDSKHHSN